MTEEKRRLIYGRRQGRPLKAGAREAFETVLPALALDIAKLSAPETLFPDLPKLALEIGFGGGEHLAAQAQQNPQAVIIGCEPFINGVAMLVGKIKAAGVSNVSVHPGDARDLMDVLPEGSIAKAFLNYPDPWPKTRHHRRRFVTPEHLIPLHRVMAPGAEFRVATDIQSYVRQTLVEVPKAGFELVSLRAVAWPDWPSTRYEQKALREGRTPTYISFRRV